MQISGSTSIALSLLRAGDLMNRKSATGAADEIDRILSAQRNANAAPPTSEKKLVNAQDKNADLIADSEGNLATAQEWFNSRVKMLRTVENDTGTWENQLARARKTIGILIGSITANNFLSHADDYRKLIDPERVAAKIDARINYAKSQGYMDTAERLLATRQQHIDESLKAMKDIADREIKESDLRLYNNQYMLGLAPAVAGASVYTDEKGVIRIDAFQQKDDQGRVIAEMKNDGSVTMYNEDGSVKETKSRKEIANNHLDYYYGDFLNLNYYVDISEEEASVYW